jgi:hypothetical protein
MYSPENAPDNFDRARFEKWRTDVFERMIESYSVDLADHHELVAKTESFSFGILDETYAEWLRSSQISNFSIVEMARTSLEVYEFILTLNDRAARRYCWSVFAEMISPLCPHMGTELFALLDSVATREPIQIEVAI